jgi:hypothetical protein
VRRCCVQRVRTSLFRKDRALRTVIAQLRSWVDMVEYASVKAVPRLRHHGGVLEVPN